MLPDNPDDVELVARAVDTGVLLCDAAGRIAWVNPEFTRTTGFELGDVAGRRRTEFMQGPFTRTEAFRALDDDLASGREVDIEFMSLTKGSRPLWSELRLRPVVDPTGRTRLIGTERDITLRRQAQEKARVTLKRTESLTAALRQEKRLLTSVLATLPVAVWWKNTDLRFVGCNAAYLLGRGLSSPADVVGRSDQQLQASDRITAFSGADHLPRDLPPDRVVEELERRVLESRQPSPPVQVTAAIAGGTVHQAVLWSLPLLGRDGGLEGVIGVATDVTHVTELERQLAQVNRLEAIGQLAAGIAHEINTPVQFVSDNNRFLADAFEGILPALRELAALGLPEVSCVLEPVDLDFVAEEVPAALEQSLEGLERVARIVRAMKDFAHPGEGLGDTDLNRAIDTTVQVARSEWKYVADLELDLDDAVGAVPCYEGEFKQMVLNLVVNAAQALGEQRERGERDGPGHIVVRTRREAETVRIEVADDGPGMPADVRARVFDPFFTTKPVGVGTGQGLSLARSVVVQKHGGTIDVVTEPGRGATFVVVLPAPRTPAMDR